MTDVIAALHKKAADAEYGAYKERWDKAYASIKQGGLVPLWESNSFREHREAQRNIFSRMIRNIKELEEKVEALQRMKADKDSA